MINHYKEKLERKQRQLSKLQLKKNDLSCDLSVNETIQLAVLESEVRLLSEVIEDFSVE